jgi:hypothetical protein
MATATRLTAVLAGVVLAVQPSGRLGAQEVGHDPTHSPYHDVPRGGGPLLTMGYLSGGRGVAGVGPSSGAVWGLRWNMRVGGMTTLVANLAYAHTNRFVVNPADSAATRTTGPFASPTALFDLGLQFALTGGKTWHGLSPYLGTALGLAIQTSAPRDSSGYRFGTKLALSPLIGTQWLPARRVTVQADLRLVFWKLNYPLSYKQPGADSTRVLALNAAESQWTRHPYVSIGVGWTF